MMKRTITNEERGAINKQHWDWLKLIALCALAGITLGAMIALTVIKLDVNGFGIQLANSLNRIGFSLLLTAGFVSIFGMVAMGTGIMIRSQMQQED